MNYNYKVGDIVEVEGDKDDPGFRDSWSQYKVTRITKRRSVTVQSLEFLAGDTDDSGPLIEVKGFNDIRPQLEDDSLTCPLSGRRCGDAVDVFKDGCWWTGRVCECYDDHITVMFPNAQVEEPPYPVWVPPREPEFYRARTAKEFDNKSVCWLAIPRVWYSQCEDFRAAHTTMLPQHNNRKRPLEPVTQGREEEAPSNGSKKNMRQGTHGYGHTYVVPRDKPMGTSKGSASQTKCMGKELSPGHDTRNAKPRRQLNTLKQDKMGQSLHTLAKSPKRDTNKSALPQNVEVARLLEDDILVGGPPLGHNAHLQGRNYAENLGSFVKEATPHVASDKKCGSHHVKGASSGALSFFDVPPPAPGATSHTHSVRCHKPNAPKAKHARQLASMLKHGKTGIASVVAEEVEEHTQLRSVLEATNAEDNSSPCGTTLATNVIHPLAKPQSIRRLEHGGSSNDRGRALPKAACILRGLKGQEEAGLQRVPSKLSQTSMSAKIGVASESVVSNYDLKARNDPKLANMSVAATSIKSTMSTRLTRRKESSAREPCERKESWRNNVLCIDYVGSLLESADFESQLRQLVDGIKELVVANVALENGVHEAGWVAAHFASEEAAAIAQNRLQFLFLQLQDVPFPMPLLVHPSSQASYPWGANFYPPGSVVQSGTCHFMQPNSLEFRPAQEWRTLDFMAAEWKRAMRESHECELEEVIQAYVDGLGDGLLYSNALRASSSDLTHPATQLWLKGLLPTQDSVKDVALAFQQWIGTTDTSDASSECAVQMIIDPVTRTFNGHALVSMKSPHQATWVMKDLNEMLFVVSTGPRPLQASVAMAGGPFGAMGTLENAMRVVCGDMRNRTKVATLLLINKAPQNQAQAVAHTLRRLLLQHQEQRVELKNKVHNERQKLHSDHKRLFEEEFSKYMRATKVNRSISVQIVMAPKEAMKRLRNPPNLFAAMLDRDNSESLP